MGNKRGWLANPCHLYERAAEDEKTAANIPQLIVTKRGDHSNFSHSLDIKA